MKKWARSNAAALLFLLTLMLVAGVLFGVALGFRMDDVRLKVRDLASFTEGWRVETHRGEAPLLEIGAHGMKVDGDLSIVRTLPGTVREGDMLCLKNQNLSVRASLNGRVFFEEGFGETIPYGAFFGMRWTAIELPEDAAGGEVKLTLSPLNRGALLGIWLDSYDSLIMFILSGSLTRIMGCLVLLAIGLISVVYALSTSQLPNGRGRIDLYFGLFCLITLIWVAADGLFLQFFIGNRALLFYLSLYSFMLMVPSFILYLRAQMGDEGRVLGWTCVANCLYVALSALVSVTKAADLVDLLPLTHLVIAASILIILLQFRKHGDSSDSREILTAVLVLGGFGVLSMVAFYMGQHMLVSQTLYGTVFMLGLLTFCLLLTVNRLKSNLRMARQAVMTEYFRKRAYTDLLTNLGNHAACQRAMEVQPTDGAFAVAMMDLNNLKETNDTQGHEAGDELLRASAMCLMEAFPGPNQVFRNGGDEFVVLMPDVTEGEAREALARFRRVVERYNLVAARKIDIACGAAARGVDGRDSLQSLMSRADRAMYADKRAAKAQDTDQ